MSEKLDEQRMDHVMSPLDPLRPDAPETAPRGFQCCATMMIIVNPHMQRRRVHFVGSHMATGSQVGPTIPGLRGGKILQYGGEWF